MPRAGRQVSADPGGSCLAESVPSKVWRPHARGGHRRGPRSTWDASTRCAPSSWGDRARRPPEPRRRASGAARWSLR